MPSFEYELLVMSLELETLDEQKDRGGYKWGKTIWYKSSKGAKRPQRRRE